MMLFGFVLVLVAVSNAQYYGTAPRPSPQPKPAIGTEVLDEIADYRSRLVILTGMDPMINGKLDTIEQKIDDVTHFRGVYDSTTRPKIHEEMKAQDERIKGFRTALKGLADLPDKVAALRVSVQNVKNGIAEARSTREEILAAVQALEDEGEEKNSQINSLQNGIAIQRNRLDMVRKAVEKDENFAGIIYGNVEKILEVFNTERAETFVLTVTDDRKELSVNYAKPFSRVPFVFWSLSHFSIADRSKKPSTPKPPAPYGYESEPYKTPAPTPNSVIDFAVVALESTETGFRIGLSDDSINFGVKSATVSLTAYIIDNQILTPEQFKHE